MTAVADVETEVAATGRPARRAGGTATQYLRYLAGRLGQSIVALWGVTTAVFFALRLSGDPARLLAPQGATQADIDNLRQQLGLARPVWKQYFSFLGDLLHGDLGYSYVQHEPAWTIISQRLPYTINLALSAFVLSIVFGVGAGVVMGLTRGRWGERLLTPIVLIGQAMPAFWIGLLLVLIFAVKLHWLPSSGDSGFTSLIMPAVTLAILSAASLARVTRGAVLEHLSRDYVRTARSKGVGTFRLVWRHLLRNIAIPVMTMLALEIANLLGGSVITEIIFAWPGIGQLTVQSVDARDFPVVQAIVIFAATIYILINLLADILYGFIDPRITNVSKGDPS